MTEDDYKAERTAKNDAERYEAAAHAVQSGVAWELEQDPSSGTPKHLRVGINLSKCEHAAIVRLLIEKGVITRDEYMEALADETECERDRYEARIKQILGAAVMLR